MQINIVEAENRLSELVIYAQAGEDVVMAVHRRTLARGRLSLSA